MNSDASRPSNRLITPWVLVSTTILGFVLFVALLILITGSALRTDPPADSALAQMTIIPAPTVTPTAPTVGEPQELTVRYVSPEGFSIGAYVSIQNTQGAGLKIRPEPGTGSKVDFIAAEGELFVIVDGPDERNGYAWWKLAGFENPERTGWGAAAFLGLVAPPADGDE